MRRKVRERLRNPNQRVYNYKYEDELSFMLAYFKECNNTTEDYASFMETTAEDCDIEMPAEVFVDGTDFETNDREIKPNLTIMKRKEQDNHEIYQDLNPADPLDVFLITIGTTLRKFSPYYLNQAKSKIFQVVQDYELQQIVNKEDQPLDNNR